MNNITYVGKHALTWTVSRHFHKGWELIYCTGGSGELVFRDRTLPYGVHDVAVIPPGLPHANQSREGFTNIHINITDLLLPAAEPFLVRGDPTGFLLDAFRAAFFYYYSEASAGRALLPVYGQLIMAFLTTHQSRHSEVVQLVENNILQHYPDCTYDLNAYLRSLPFNTEYLKKMFKKETGLTPLQYLTEKRLESAASTLSTCLGKRSVSEAARICGFADPLYFSRLFKKKYGTSPRDYTGDASLSGAGEAQDVKIML